MSHEYTNLVEGYGSIIRAFVALDLGHRRKCGVPQRLDEAANARFSGGVFIINNGVRRIRCAVSLSKILR
jgi:hypothetical protein